MIVGKTRLENGCIGYFDTIADLYGIEPEGDVRSMSIGGLLAAADRVVNAATTLEHDEWDDAARLMMFVREDVKLKGCGTVVDWMDLDDECLCDRCMAQRRRS